MKKNKLVNLLKIGVLLFGMSILLLNCEKENLSEQQEVSIENKFQELFNKDDFKQTIPFEYDVDWNNTVKEYSKELETNFYEFELVYNTPFNPTIVNKTKREGYNTAYKLVVTESTENNLTFFIAKFFQEKEKSIEIKDLSISLNKSTGYRGFTHLYNSENELHFAKQINKEENKKPKLYFKDKVKAQDSNLQAKGDETICTTSTLYNYIDWYRYTYDAWGNLISVVFLYTEYVGSSSTTSCTTEFIPDQPIRNIKNPIYVSCQDGSGRTNCVKAVEPQIICEVGFEPNENGSCVEVKKLTLDDLGLDEFGFSDTLGLTDEQKDWINDIRNKEAKDAITDYLNSFAFPPEFDNAKVFAYQSILALFGNELMTVNDINFEDKIINELTGKAECLYEELEKLSSGFKNAIKKFDGDFPVSHISFKINDTLPMGNYGITNPPSNFNITIEFSNTQLGNISDLGGAVAFAHEMIHAEIFRKMLSAAQQGDLNAGQYTTQNRINYINSLQNNFPGIYDYYIERYKPTWNHNLIAQHYTSIIADIAEEFDNNSLSRQVYEDIAWAGLRIINNPITNGTETSIAWDNLSPQVKSRVKSNLSNYFHNGTKNCN